MDSKLAGNQVESTTWTWWLLFARCNLLHKYLVWDDDERRFLPSLHKSNFGTSWHWWSGGALPRQMGVHFDPVLKWPVGPQI